MKMQTDIFYDDSDRVFLFFFHARYFILILKIVSNASILFISKTIH